MKVKTILVSQPKPETEKSPYFDLSDKCKVKVDFRSFIHLEGIDSKEFRTQKVNIEDFGAIIFTSRNAVDHFFRIAEELRYNVSDDLKYFCISESTAYYLQKYVVYRKRKIFHGRQTMEDLMPLIKKHKGEKFLLPCADILKKDIPEVLEKNSIDFKQAVLYRTVCSDLSDLADVNYDVLVFFSPAGIASLYENFPEFKQNDTRIAVFGETTKKAAIKSGLEINIAAPAPNAPSMTGAIEVYKKEHS